jgi:hypothetical protein
MLHNPFTVHVPGASGHTKLTTIATGDGRKTNEIRLKPAAAERGSRSRPRKTQAHAARSTQQEGSRLMRPAKKKRAGEWEMVHIIM